MDVLGAMRGREADGATVDAWDFTTVAVYACSKSRSEGGAEHVVVEDGDPLDSLARAVRREEGTESILS